MNSNHQDTQITIETATKNVMLVINGKKSPSTTELLSKSKNQDTSGVIPDQVLTQQKEFEATQIEQSCVLNGV